MRKRILFYVGLLVTLFVFAGTIWAETSVQSQTRRYKRNMVCTVVREGIPVDPISGTVADVCPMGVLDGMTITKSDCSEDCDVTVYGLGSMAYWDSLGIARPVFGDQVTVEVRKVSLTADTYRYILMSLEYADGTSIDLRDPETGCPLWRPAGGVLPKK